MKAAETKGPRSFEVGPSEVGRILRCSRWRAAKILREWAAEQEAGGPRRVRFGYPPRGGRCKTWLTTLGWLDREFGTTERGTERKLRELEKALDFESRRRAELTSRVEFLEKLVRMLAPSRVVERAIGKRA